MTKRPELVPILWIEGFLDRFGAVYLRSITLQLKSLPLWIPVHPLGVSIQIIVVCSRDDYPFLAPTYLRRSGRSINLAAVQPQVLPPAL